MVKHFHGATYDVCITLEPSDGISKIFGDTWNEVVTSKLKRLRSLS